MVQRVHVRKVGRPDTRVYAAARVRSLAGNAA